MRRRKRREGFRIIRAILGEFVARVHYMCINMRTTPLVRIMRRCRNDATEKSRYAARCTVRHVYGRPIIVSAYLHDILHSTIMRYIFVPLERLDRQIARHETLRARNCIFFRQFYLFLFLLDIFAIRILVLLEMAAIIIE